MPVGKSAIVYDHYQYQWQKRLVVFFLFFGTMLGVGSFISDVFNYLQFVEYVSDSPTGLISLYDFKTTFLAFVILAGIIYGLEVIFMLLAFGGMWPRSSNGRQAIMWTREVFSIVDSITCDVTFLILYYLSFGAGFCAMLQQMRTLRGKIAVAFTTAHTIFAFLQSIYYRKVVGRYPSNCERLLKTFGWMLHLVVAALAIFALVVAYINNPIHSSMTRKQFRQWGFGEMQTAPVYFVNDLDVADVIRKQFDATGVNLSSANGSTPANFDVRLDRILQCKSLRAGFYLADLKDIVDAEDGILKSFKCSEVFSYFEYMIQEEHKPFINQADCSILAKVRYDFQSSKITYAVGYELRSVDDENECHGAYFNVIEPQTVNVAPYEIRLSPESALQINRILIGNTCSLSGCSANSSRTGDNLFSCLDKNCVSYNSTEDAAASVKVSALRIAWNLDTYQSDLKSLRSLLQCRVGVKADEADLQLCTNSTQQYTDVKNLSERCV